ncbi:MAG TPA: hypothetical protein VFM24_08905, partial [Nitrospira sp.]|nr:hypothetical protein [Nitrospira sp.]
AWLRPDVYAVTRSADALGAAAGAAARSRELSALAEDESAVLAHGRFQHEPSSLVAGDCLHDMFQMIFNLTFSNT